MNTVFVANIVLIFSIVFLVQERCVLGFNQKSFFNFQVNYEQGQKCGNKFRVAPGELTSPNFGSGNYPRSSNCHWVISSSDTKKGLNLEFLEFQLEQSNECVYDNVTIYDGESQLAPKTFGPFCGNKLPGSIKSSSSKLRVVFRSDENMESTGFKIKYTETEKVCEHVFDKDSGEIVSPNYPNRHPATIECSYKILVKQGDTILLNFINFKLEDSKGCNFDYLEVYDGETDDSKVLGKFCGNQEGSRLIKSTGNKMFIKFVADSSNQNDGFRLQYHAMDKVDKICKRPAYKGDCRAAFRRWYYNAASGKCEQFIYGGCLSNGNNFRSMKECEAFCNKGATRTVNPCAIANGGCEQLCINEHDSHYCLCNKGYKPMDNRNKTCGDIDECSNNNGNCQHTCINTIGSFKCSCPLGYQRDKTGLNCIDINECLVNNGGCKDKCINLPSGFKCACYDGFREVRSRGNTVTCEDIDECSSGSHECDVNLGATCVNGVGDYSCVCPAGYQLQGKKCIDIDECANPQKNTCSQQCTNVPGSFYCKCFHGYVLNGDSKKCTDIDECATFPCNQHCINSMGSYQCLCNTGYSLESDEKTCSDIDECDDRNGLCDQTCINTNGSYHCECLPGYKKIDEQGKCEDIDECLLGTSCCEGSCFNQPGGYKCGCSEGHFISKNNCSCQDINECSINNGGCDHYCNNTKGTFSCSCREGYMLDPTDSSRCIDINECLQGNGGCSQICNNTDGGYECKCRAIFKLAPDGKTCDHCPSCESYEELITVVEKLQLEVQSLKNWKASQDVKKNVCRFKKKVYEYGKNWNDGKCRRCFCQEGQVLCFQDKKCFDLNKKQKPGACPPLNKICSFRPENTCLSDEDCSEGEKCCQQDTCNPDKICRLSINKGKVKVNADKMK